MTGSFDVITMGRVGVDIYPLEVGVALAAVNGLGAGDGFGGALCQGRLAGRPLERALQFANAEGATVASRLACSVAMPTTGEVEEFLSV